MALGTTAAAISGLRGFAEPASSAAVSEAASVAIVASLTALAEPLAAALLDSQISCLEQATVSAYG